MNVSSTIRSFYDNYVARATIYLLYLLIVLIPFSVRNVIDSSWNSQLGFYSDFTSISLYLSDIILGFIIALSLYKLKHTSLPRLWKYSAIIFVIWLILELLIQNSDNSHLQLYFTIRFIALIAFAVIVSKIEVSRERIAWLLTILGGFQALIAIFQHYTQKSVGLYFLGESHIGHHLSGIANIVSHGTKILRSYGTFPHPNVLAGFLVIAIAFNLYLITKNYQFPRGIILYLTPILCIFALFLTFSRGGLLGFSIAIILLSVLLHINKQYIALKRIFAPVSIGIVLSLAILWPHLASRATITDNASKQRLFFNDIGDTMINANPLFGFGQSMSLLHMKQYSKVPLEQWEVQPVHNYYILSWAEQGVGALLLLILILFPIFTLFKRNINLWNMVLVSIGVGLLGISLLDHYFYTIWPAQILFWLIIGLCLNSSNPQSNISRETLF